MNKTLKEQPEVSSVEETLRQPMTILFSDITGSTTYFEQRGDIEGLRMLERHNSLMFPCIDGNNGRVIKTIGDAIMAIFQDPVDALNAAVAMQLELLEDGRSLDPSDQIHVRIGVHSGLGLDKGNDVFGDVVNAAARVQEEAQPDQIVITDSLLSAADTAGYHVAKLGRARMKGKGEPIELYAVGWSPLATQGLIEGLEQRLEHQERKFQQSKTDMEEAFDRSRAEWSKERRKLNTEIDRLEEDARSAFEAARNEVTEEFTREVAFKIETVEKARAQLEEKLKNSQERFDAERESYERQIESLEDRLVESIAKLSNPVRSEAQIRDQIQARLKEVKREWESQWQAERAKLVEAIDTAKNPRPTRSVDEARRLVMERIKARQEGRGQRSAMDEAVDAKARLERECDELRTRVLTLESELRHVEEHVRIDVCDELRQSYDQKIEEAQYARSQLEREVRSLSEELEAEKRLAAVRIEQLEAAVAEAGEVARAQAVAEALSEQNRELFAAKRMAARAERRYHEAEVAWNIERAQIEKRIEEMSLELARARENAFRRPSDPTIEELNRLRRQLEEEYRVKATLLEQEERSPTTNTRDLKEFQDNA